MSNVHRNAPAAFDRVEILDESAATRVSALVESAGERLLVLRLEQETRVPEEASVRWFDGATAWQAAAKIEHLDAKRVSCRIVEPHAWEAARVRRSPRAPMDRSRLLVRVVSSGVLAGGRRVNAVCLDVSATGCRTAWPGRVPRVGDRVDLTWDVDRRVPGTVEVGWVAARVVRVIPQASGAFHVCLDFEATSLAQAARIRACHKAWVQRHQQRLRGETAA